MRPSQGTSYGFALLVEEEHTGRLIGCTEGEVNTKLCAVTGRNGCLLDFFMTAGQISGYIGAAAFLGSLPKAEPP